MMSYKNKRVALLGLGEENLGLLKHLLEQGAIISICDRKSRAELEDKIKDLDLTDIDFVCGEGYLDELEKYDIIFRTPGLPYLTPQIQDAKAAGVEISSQIKLFFSSCPSPIICITGTKGKGTTATLIAEILKWKSEARNPKSERRIYLGGNIGTPPIS